MREIRIQFSNRALYTLVAVGVLILVGAVVYAYGGTQPSVVGHTLGEIAPPTGCSSGQFLQWSGSAWQCTAAGGIQTETDPTVLTSVKDGVSWAEVTGKPAGFADNVDNSGITTQNNCYTLSTWNNLRCPVGYYVAGVYVREEGMHFTCCR